MKTRRFVLIGILSLFAASPVAEPAIALVARSPIVRPLAVQKSFRILFAFIPHPDPGLLEQGYEALPSAASPDLFSSFVIPWMGGLQAANEPVSWHLSDTPEVDDGFPSRWSSGPGFPGGVSYDDDFDLSLFAYPSSVDFAEVFPAGLVHWFRPNSVPCRLANHCLYSPPFLGEIGDPALAGRAPPI